MIILGLAKKIVFEMWGGRVHPTIIILNKLKNNKGVVDIFGGANPPSSPICAYGI